MTSDAVGRILGALARFRERVPALTLSGGYHASDPLDRRRIVVETRFAAVAANGMVVTASLHVEGIALSARALGDVAFGPGARVTHHYSFMSDDGRPVELRLEQNLVPPTVRSLTELRGILVRVENGDLLGMATLRYDWRRFTRGVDTGGPWD